MTIKNTLFTTFLLFMLSPVVLACPGKQCKLCDHGIVKQLNLSGEKSEKVHAIYAEYKEKKKALKAEKMEALRSVLTEAEFEQIQAKKKHEKKQCPHDKKQCPHCKEGEHHDGKKQCSHCKEGKHGKKCDHHKHGEQSSLLLDKPKNCDKKHAHKDH